MKCLVELELECEYYCGAPYNGKIVWSKKVEVVGSGGDCPKVGSLVRIASDTPVVGAASADHERTRLCRCFDRRWGGATAVRSRGTEEL
ncbi:MAG: hypothetical protein QF464_04720 [Myxococcota bacterium]|nr:hypothetical protein [Myxococcota bacterium]